VQGDKTSAVVCAGGAGSGEAVRVSGRHSSQIPGDNRRWRAAEEDLEDNLLTGGARTVRSRPTGGTARALGPLGSSQRERERERELGLVGSATWIGPCLAAGSGPRREKKVPLFQCIFHPT
jgi:hypothetical protein